MPEFLTTLVDKFTFKVALDRYYTVEGVWALAEGNHVRIGLSDFLQQRSGDVAFADIRPEGTAVKSGEEVAIIETIKVNISLISPLAGVVVEVNPALSAAPEAINQDPYGAGWLAVVETVNWEAEQSHLLTAAAYFDHMKRQAEAEAKQE
jgi:glycine cleavage system H protein